MGRLSLVFIMLLISAEFFQITYIPKNLRLLLLFACVVFIIISVIIWAIYDHKQGFKRNFNLEVILFLLSSVFAMIGAKIGHGQVLFLSAWVQIYMYFYFFYFFLHIVKLRPHELERILIIVAITWLAVYFIQYIVYPRLITDARVGAERGTVRIFLPGGAFAKLIFFYFLQKLFQTNNYRYAIYCIAYLVVPILQGTRNAIATILFGVLIVILFSKYVKSRIVVIILACFAAFLFFIIFQDIIYNLVDVSSNQMGKEEDDIRERSATFYLTEFYPNKINYIIGNGAGHMKSPYGLKLMYFQISHGFYLSDLGILNGYIKFGVLYVIAMLLIIRKILVLKIAPRYNYIRFWVVLLIIQSILGYPFMSPFSIATILSVLYIIDVSNFEMNELTNS